MAGVSRFFEETIFHYDVTAVKTNPWYTFLRDLAPVIAEKCGFTIVDNKATTNGFVTFSIPNFPGKMRISAQSGSYSYYSAGIDLRNDKDDTSLSSASAQLFYDTGLKGNITIGFSHIGDFLYWLYLGPTDYPGSGSSGWVGAFWGWFNGAYTGNIYFPYRAYGVGSYGSTHKTDLLKAIADSSNFKNITREDTSVGSDKASFSSYAQPGTGYPSDPSANQLRPYMHSCASGDAAIPNPGLCKWGGKYMLYVLTQNNSETPVDIQPGVEYKINGKNYLGCAARLILPEPWPFKEA